MTLSLLPGGQTTSARCKKRMENAQNVWKRTPNTAKKHAGCAPRGANRLGNYMICESESITNKYIRNKNRIENAQESRKHAEFAVRIQFD